MAARAAAGCSPARRTASMSGERQRKRRALRARRRDIRATSLVPRRGGPRRAGRDEGRGPSGNAAENGGWRSTACVCRPPEAPTTNRRAPGGVHKRARSRRWRRSPTSSGPAATRAAYDERTVAPTWTTSSSPTPTRAAPRARSRRTRKELQLTRRRGGAAAAIASKQAGRAPARAHELAQERAAQAGGQQLHGPRRPVAELRESHASGRRQMCVRPGGRRGARPRLDAQAAVGRCPSRARAGHGGDPPRAEADEHGQGGGGTRRSRRWRGEPRGRSRRGDTRGGRWISRLAGGGGRTRSQLGRGDDGGGGGPSSRWSWVARHVGHEETRVAASAQRGMHAGRRCSQGRRCGGRSSARDRWHTPWTTSELVDGSPSDLLL